MVEVARVAAVNWSSIGTRGGKRGVGEGRGRRKDGGEAMKPREVEEETKQAMELSSRSVHLPREAWLPLFLFQYVTWCVPAGGWSRLLYAFAVHMLLFHFLRVFPSKK